MTIEWNRVTWYSKLVAVVVFLATFGVAFCLGTQWERQSIEHSLNEGGSAPVVGPGEHCGGFIKDAPVCSTGYHCQLKVSSPDTGGTCVKD